MNHSQHLINVKGVPAATRPRAFFLWLCLLGLYFLIVPSTAEQGRPMAADDGAAATISVDSDLLRSRGLASVGSFYRTRP
ncbi:MAG: hypothetical protein R3286_08035 [Gammaproteobacteria bacterium]|nr:hypothetical protein [Gammaproteobacteria bacterium]